jgi:hypothetical protein
LPSSRPEQATDIHCGIAPVIRERGINASHKEEKKRKKGRTSIRIEPSDDRLAFTRTRLVSRERKRDRDFVQDAGFRGVMATPVEIGNVFGSPLRCWQPSTEIRSEKKRESARAALFKRRIGHSIEPTVCLSLAPLARRLRLIGPATCTERIGKAIRRATDGRVAASRRPLYIAAGFSLCPTRIYSVRESVLGA